MGHIFLRFFWLTHRTYIGHHFNVKIQNRIIRLFGTLKKYTTVQFSGDEIL